MANFTYDIKRDIISSPFPSEEEKIALLSAFFKASAVFSYDFVTKLYGFEVVTESEECAEFFLGLTEELFSCSPTSTVNEDRLSGKNKLRFELKGERAEEILFRLNLLKTEDGSKALAMDVFEGYYSDPILRRAFICGAFLGGGSCTVPGGGAKTGYHLQFYLSNWQTANALSEMLVEEDILPKQIEHNGSYVVYVNSKDAISDFLSYAGAFSALKQLDRIVDKRDIANNANRVSNCSSGNQARAKSASAKTVAAIKEIDSLIGLNTLPKGLKDVANARLSDPEGSLSSIALSTGLTKSCVNHRLKKLMKIYESLIK